MDDQSAVVGALKTSAEAWSSGDLDGFMRCYEDGPDTTYVKSDGIVRGYRTIRDMYASRFAAASGALGRLSLDVLDFRALGPAYALVTGRYHLQPATPGPEASGIFTLVFHRSAVGWRIVSDHTS